MDSLTDRILEYQRTGHGRDVLVRAIAIITYSYLDRKHGFTEDDKGDFLLFFYPRIDAVIRRFRAYGKPFEAYLHTNLKWQMMTYARKKRALEQRSRLCARDDIWVDVLPLSHETGCAWEPSACEPAIPPSLRHRLRVDTSGKLVDRGVRRRAILVGLKAALYLTPPQIERLALLTDWNAELLHDRCAELKQRVERRLKRFEVLSERRNRAFILLQCLEEEEHRTPDGEQKVEIQRECSRIRNRYERARAEALAVLRTPTHREIADVLGIPKGSVDSGIYYARAAASDRPIRKKHQKPISAGSH